jgi:predicted GNAT family N-acyltransferase
LLNNNKKFTVKVTDWQTDFVKLTGLRVRVFVLEQNIPPEEEVDAIDWTCAHVIALDEKGNAVGCGRLIDEKSTVQPAAYKARIGRMAVHPDWRGAGVGRAMLELLVTESRSRGYSIATLSAQEHAIPFYAKNGFVIEGSQIMDCGIPHREMVLSLNKDKR